MMKVLSYASTTEKQLLRSPLVIEVLERSLIKEELEDTIYQTSRNQNYVESC